MACCSRDYVPQSLRRWWVVVCGNQGKFGKLSGRIVRLLLDKKLLEEKNVRIAFLLSVNACDGHGPCTRDTVVRGELQIGEILMIPGKEARGLLYKLLQSRIVHLEVRPCSLPVVHARNWLVVTVYSSLQELATKPDHNPQNTFYLWGVVRDHGAPFDAAIMRCIWRCKIFYAFISSTEPCACGGRDLR